MGFRPLRPVISPDDPDAFYNTPFTGKPLAESSSDPFVFGDTRRPVALKRYLEIIGHDGTLGALISQVNNKLADDCRVAISTDNSSGANIVTMIGGGTSAIAEILSQNPSVDMTLKVFRGEYWSMSSGNNVDGIFRDPTSSPAYTAYRGLRDSAVSTGAPFEEQKSIVYYITDSTHPDDVIGGPGGNVYYSVMTEEGEAMLTDWISTFDANPGIINVANRIPTLDEIVGYLQLEV